MERIPKNSSEEVAEPTAESEKPRRRIQDLVHWLAEHRGGFRLGSTSEKADAEDSETAKNSSEGKSWFRRVRHNFRRLFITIAEPEFVHETGPLPAAETTTPEPLVAEAIDRSAAETKPDLEIPELPELTIPSPAERPPERPAERLSPPPAVVAAAERVMAPIRGVETVPSPTTHTVERTVESRGAAGAVAALLGLEYLGRHRGDRKNRKRSHKLERQQAKNQAVTKQLEQQTGETQAELQDFKRLQQTLEAQPARQEKPKQPELPVTPLAELKRTEAKAAPIPPAINEKLPLAEQVVRRNEAIKKPETILERVEAAAERDIPVEAIYERRHEVKDQQPFEAGAAIGGPGSVQAPVLLAQALQQRVQATNRAAMVATQAAEQNQPGDLYKQAVKSGVWGAVILLFGLAIIFLFAR